MLNIYIILLYLVQFTAISTFLIFLTFVFFPKIKNKNNNFKKYFLENNNVKKDFIVLTFFYIYLFSYLFILNNQYSNIYIYIIGFVISMIGLITAIIGRLQLRKLWNPLTNIYNSKKILNTGIYKIIRHPIYFGRFFFFLGVVLMINLNSILLTPLYWDYLRNKMITEENYLLKVNPKYKNYMNKTKRIIF